MSKHKKMLLISLCTLLASCSDIPQAPKVAKVTPIWKDGTDPGRPEILYFYGRWYGTDEQVVMPLPAARENGLVCTDMHSYTESEMYIRELERLAKLRCR